MLLLSIYTKCTIIIFGHGHYDIFCFKTKQIVDYKSFFLIYYLKSLLTVLIRAMNKTYI